MEGIVRNKIVKGESDFRRWDELSFDVLGLIFKDFPFQDLLQVISRVCKTWGKVVEGPYCWKKIDIYMWCRKHRNKPENVDRMLRMLIPRSSGLLRELSVSYVSDDGMSFIAEHAQSLQTLILKRSTITDSIVEKVAPNFSSVTSLDLSFNSGISNRALEAIGKNCKNLESLTYKADRSYSRDSASAQANAIAHTMPKLKDLNLSSRVINTANAIEILTGCPEIKTLYILRCYNVGIFDREKLKETYPKVKFYGPSDNMGIFDGDSTDYGSDASEEEWDTWIDYSSGISSEEEFDESRLYDYSCL